MAGTLATTETAGHEAGAHALWSSIEGCEGLEELCIPGYGVVPPNLLAAADYLLEQVELPRQYGPREIVEHDMRTCQNPRCRRPTIRLEDHHLDPQKNGVNNDPANLLGLCPGVTSAACTNPTG